MALTRSEVEARSGVSAQLSERLWRALGFVTAETGEVAFVDSDAEALALLGELAAGGGEAEVVAVTRTTGAMMSRIADANAGAVVAGLRDPERSASAAGDLERIATVLPVLDRLVHLAWRRHLHAAMVRAMEVHAGPARPLTVGFADLVGYTALSRTLEVEELLALVERLEAAAGDTVVQLGGRVVKSLGDGLLFSSADPSAGAEIALALVELGETDGLPPVHAGLAHGEVLVVRGDVVGPVVNVAARLQAMARPGTVLADRGAAVALAADPRFHIRELRPVHVRGYAHLVAHVLRRA